MNFTLTRCPTVICGYHGGGEQRDEQHLCTFLCLCNNGGRFTRYRQKAVTNAFTGKSTQLAKAAQCKLTYPKKVVLNRFATLLAAGRVCTII